MIVKVLCSALLFLAFATNARGQPSLHHMTRRIEVFGTTKLDMKITETTVHFPDESLPYLEQRKMDELIEVANHRDFRVSEVMRTLRAGQEPLGVRAQESQGGRNEEPQGGSNEEAQRGDAEILQDNLAESMQGPDGSQLGSGGPTGQESQGGSNEAPQGGSNEDAQGGGAEKLQDNSLGDVDTVEGDAQNVNPEGQENIGEASDDTVDQKNDGDDNGNTGSQNGGKNDDNPENEGDVTVDGGQNGDEEFDEYDDDDDYDDDGGDDVDDEKRRRDKKKRPRSKQNNRAKSKEGQGSQGKTRTSNSPNSGSKQNSKSAQSNQNSRNSHPSKKLENTRTNTKSPASQPKNGITNSQGQSGKRSSSKSGITKRQRHGTKRYSSRLKGRRVGGLRGRSAVFRKLRDETLRHFPKNNLRDPKNGTPLLEQSKSSDPRNGKRFEASDRSKFNSRSGTVDGGFGAGTVIGGAAGAGVAGAATGGGSTVAVGVPTLAFSGGSILATVIDLATPDVNGEDDRRSYQSPKSVIIQQDTPGRVDPNNRNINNRQPGQQAGYPDKVNLNGRRGPDQGRVDPNNRNTNNRQAGKASKDDHNNLSPDDDLPDQDGEDDLNVPSSNVPEPTHPGEDDPEQLSPNEDVSNHDGEDDLNVPNSTVPEPTHPGEDDPEQLSPNEDVTNHNGGDDFDASNSEYPETTQQGEDDPEKLNPNGDLSHHQHSQQGEKDFDNLKPSNRPLARYNNRSALGKHFNEEDSDELQENLDAIFEDYTPHNVQEAAKITNAQEQSPFAIHHGDHVNITVNDVFGRAPRVNGVGKKYIRNNTHEDALDYDPAFPVRGRNRLCEPENKLRTKFTVPLQCCGPKFACPLYIIYNGPGSGIDTVKNLAIQRDCHCELNFYKCLEEHSDPAQMHPFFLFLHDSCLIKKTDVSTTQPIGFRVLNTAEFITFPMYN